MLFTFCFLLNGKFFFSNERQGEIIDIRGEDQSKYLLKNCRGEIIIHCTNAKIVRGDWKNLLPKLNLHFAEVYDKRIIRIQITSPNGKIVQFRLINNLKKIEEFRYGQVGLLCFIIENAADIDAADSRISECKHDLFIIRCLGKCGKVVKYKDDTQD